MQRLASDICNALTVHTKIDEEIFYPAFRWRTFSVKAGTRRAESGIHY